MLRWMLLQIIAVVLALAAANISFNLLARHMSGSPGPTWFEAGCTAKDEGGGADCAAVLASTWSYWPPVREGDPPDKPRIPVAFLGLVYYSMLAIWFVGVGRPSLSRRWVLYFPSVLMLFGLVASALFTYVMFARLDEWCPWCMVTHILNLLIAVCLVLMWPRRSQAEMAAARAAASPAGHEEGSGTTTAASPYPGPLSPPHPSWRLLIVTLVAVVLVAFGQNQVLGRAQLAKNAGLLQVNFRRCMAQVGQIRQDGDMLMTHWETRRRHDIQLRPDDPTGRGSTSDHPSLAVVLFSDFECPSCKSFAEFLDEEAQPLFDGNLAVTFKHYPLDSGCNPHVTGRTHPHACFAARLAEAARLLGGVEAFWSAHDLLFENQDRLKRGKIEPQEVADHLGLEGQAFADAMNDETVTTRIEEDINQARQLGVRSTPAPFVDGRLVSPLYTREANFWTKLARKYRPDETDPHSDSTKVAPSTATPGTPDPTAAP